MPTPAEIERMKRAKEGKPPLPGMASIPTQPTGSPISFGGGTRPGTGGFDIDPRISMLVDYSGRAREGDMAKGETFGNRFFGPENADMAAIIKARKDAAYGTDPTLALQRAQGISGVNQTMQTAMRGLGSRLATNGVRGGAAAGMAAPIARDALNARQGLETNLAINEQKRRDAALGSLESTLTGERSGLLSSIFGFAGLGSQDRGNATQTVLGQDYLKFLQPGMSPGVADGSKAPVSVTPTQTGPQVWDPHYGYRTELPPDWLHADTPEAREARRKFATGES